MVSVVVQGLVMSGVARAQDKPAAAAAPKPAAAPPLPVHTIEGGGGGAVTNIAYPVNARPKDELFGLPSVSYTYLNLADKATHTAAVTQTLYGRIELGYAFTYLSLGDLDNDLGAGQDNLQMHTFTARVLALEEGTLATWNPAVTVGAHLKHNHGVDRLDQQIGGALTTLGYDKDWGVDFTITGSKMLPDVLGRPMIVSAGVRFTEGAWGGLVGFTHEYQAALEASAVWLITDNIFVAYEYRMMPDAYGELGAIVQEETDWHIVDVGWIINEHATLTGLYGYLGNIVDSNVPAAFAVQLKFEF
jgi:hypothetical protein